MKNKKIALLWLMTIAWTVLLFTLSGQPAEESAKLSGGLTAYILGLLSFLDVPYDVLEHVLRKLAHFCIFGVEGMLVYASVKFSLKKYAARISAAACVAVAALNEYHQTFSEGRSAELRDVLIDSAGAFLGIAAVWICYYLMKSRRRA